MYTNSPPPGGRQTIRLYQRDQMIHVYCLMQPIMKVYDSAGSRNPGRAKGQT